MGAGPDPQDGHSNAGRREQHEPVQHLAELVRISGMDVLADDRRRTGERVEHWWRVVLAARLRAGNLAVVDQQVGVW